MLFTPIRHNSREEWLKWRHGGIGSSDASIIMGVSRFNTRDKLVLEKSQPEPKAESAQSYITDRGNKIELYVRKFYGEHIGTTFYPLSCMNAAEPWKLATLDGTDADLNLILEIKLLSSIVKGKDYPKPPDGLKKWLAAKDGKVPEEYLPQMQHQIMVTGIPFCVMLGLKEYKGLNEYSWENIVALTVQRDEKYIKHLDAEEKKFWNEVLTARRDLGKLTA